MPHCPQMGPPAIGLIAQSGVGAQPRPLAFLTVKVVFLSVLTNDPGLQPEVQE